MKNRKILIVLLAMLLIVSAVGCAAKQPAETAAPAETKTDAPAEPAQTEETGAYVIGFNNYNMGSDFPQQLYAGLEAAAAEAVVDQAAEDAVGLYDRVTVYVEEDDETETYQIVTTMRQDALHGLISRESPVGKAVLGKKVGDRVHIQVDADYGYDVVIRAIEKAKDDGSIPLNKF